MENMPHLIGKKIEDAKTIATNAGYIVRVFQKCANLKNSIGKGTFQMNRINVEVAGKIPNIVVIRQEIG